MLYLSRFCVHSVYANASEMKEPVNMPLVASTGPVLVRCWQRRTSTGPVLAHNGMFMGSRLAHFSKLQTRARNVILS